MAAVLEEPLMTDPDLSLSNGRNLAAVAAGPVDGSLPDLSFPPDEAAAASAAALRQTGARLRAPVLLPQPSPRLEAVKEADFARRAGRLVDRPACAAGLRPGFEWAEAPSLPPIYPRARLLMAAGTARPDCAMAAATTLTPVDPAQVLGFYHARMKAAGYRDAASRTGEALLLEGIRNGSRFAVLIRPAGPGTTQIDVVATPG